MSMSKITLKAARVNKGLTQAAAAKLIGIAQATLRAYEQGVRLPSVEIVTRMLDVYEQPFESIIWTRKDQ